MQREEYIEGEFLIIRSEGEIPEVAYHSAIYYLVDDPEGPGLCLGGPERAVLRQAVILRYRDIIIRDLTPANRDLGLYRGLERAAANWERLQNFSRSAAIDITAIREEVANSLLHFLYREATDIESKIRSCSINCTASRLAAFVASLPLEEHKLPENWQKLCCD